MPTTLPRVNVAFDPGTYEVLEELSKAEHASLSAIVSKLVQSALELSEDLALGELAGERLASFRRDGALTSQDLLKWNRARRKSR